MNLMKYICDAISQKVNSSLLAHIGIIEQYYRHKKELIISGADSGIFVRGVQLFQNFDKQKKGGEVMKTVGGGGGLWWLFPFCRSMVYVEVSKLTNL